MTKIDDAWNDLLGDDEPASASKPKPPKIAAPPVPGVAPRSPAPKTPRAAPRAPELSLPPLGSSRPTTPEPADSETTPEPNTAQLPPPPEFSARESSAELPLEAMASVQGANTDELDIDLDTSGSSPIPSTPSEDELDVDLDASASDLPRASTSGDELVIDFDASASDLPPTKSGDEELDVDLDTSGSSVAISMDGLDDDDPGDSGVSSVEVSNWKATGPVEEVMHRPPTNGPIAAVRTGERRSAPFANALPVERSRVPWPWIAGGVAAVLAVGLLLWSGSGNDEETTRAPADVAAKDGPKQSPPDEATPTKTEDEPSAPTEPVPTEMAALDDAAATTGDGGTTTTTTTNTTGAETETDAASTTDSASTTTDPDPALDDEMGEPEATEPEATEPEPAEPPAPPTGPSPDYAAAAAEHEATGSQESLLAMVLAACSDDDGALARTAMRKLKGKELRNEAIVGCKKTKVDVLASVKTYTGPEFLRQAQAALDRGDAEAALSLARASNKVERTGKAGALMFQAACAMGDGAQAQRLLTHVPKKWRPELVDSCAAEGVSP